MRSIIRRWLLARVIRSALAFEADAIHVYRELQERATNGVLRGGVQHLLQEEETHWRILTDAAQGKFDPEELERTLGEHLYASLPAIRPLTPDELGPLASELTAAYEKEKDTFVFYGNLGRISKIPVVRKAFHVLADMEKEHVKILGRLLGLPEP